MRVLEDLLPMPWTIYAGERIVRWMINGGKRFGRRLIG